MHEENPKMKQYCVEYVWASVCERPYVCLTHSECCPSFGADASPPSLHPSTYIYLFLCVYLVYYTKYTQCCAHIRPTNTFSHAFPFPKQVYQVRSMLPRNAPTCARLHSIMAIISLFVLLLMPFYDYILQRTMICAVCVCNNNRSYGIQAENECIRTIRIETRSTQFVRAHVWFGLTYA